MIIYKFGGTSVGSPDRMKQVAKLITANNEPKIVVLSAMSGTTNTLVQIALSLYNQNKDEAIKLINDLETNYYSVVNNLYSSTNYKEKGKELIKSYFEYIYSFTLDMFTIHEEKAILAQGELLSTALFHFYLEEQNIKSVLLPALNFMRVDKTGDPDMYYIKENLRRELEKYTFQNLIITQGYICRNMYGEIDNLKRGGSDYSATLIGAAVNAKEIQIWTDIDGMHNNDPRYVENTYPIDHLSFEEASELAYFGAKILHPSSMIPAMMAKIPVRLKNTMKPEAAGTLITETTDHNAAVKAIAAKDEIVAINIKSDRMLMAYGFLRKIFEIFESYRTPIDMITTSEVAVTVTIDDKTHLHEITEELKKYGTVTTETNMTIICIVGDNIIEQKGIIRKIFDSLENISIHMISVGGSKNNVSVLINTKDRKDALTALNQIF